MQNHAVVMNEDKICEGMYYQKYLATHSADLPKLAKTFGILLKTALIKCL